MKKECNVMNWELVHFISILYFPFSSFMVSFPLFDGLGTSSLSLPSLEIHILFRLIIFSLPV